MRFSGAWEFFKSGDSAAYLATVAAAVDCAYANGAYSVALARASMAGAAERVTRGATPLTSPQTGLVAAIDAATRAAEAQAQK